MICSGNTSCFGNSDLPSSSANWDHLRLALECRRGAQSKSGKALAMMVARSARLPAEAHVEKCGSCAGQLSAVVGVIPLHARTVKRRTFLMSTNVQEPKLRPGKCTSDSSKNTMTRAVSQTWASVRHARSCDRKLLRHRRGWGILGIDDEIWKASSGIFEEKHNLEMGNAQWTIFQASTITRTVWREVHSLEYVCAPQLHVFT